MIGVALLTLLKGQKMGSDNFGSVYYQERFFLPKPKTRKPRRWVVYKGIPQASKVPASWHGWLHYTTDQTPEKLDRKAHSWEKPHLPNLTGTKKAYRPPMDVDAKVYKAWKP